MKKNFSVPFIIFIMCAAIETSAANEQFGNLFDCYLAITRDSYNGKGNRLNQDYHLVHVQRFSEKSTAHTLAPTGVDSFLVLNRSGAQVMNPKFELSQSTITNEDGHSETHNQRNYWMTVIPPGESKPTHVQYYIDEVDKRFDSSSGYGAPGLTKEVDVKHAKHKNDPVKSAAFMDAITLLRKPIKNTVELDEYELKSGKKLDDLNFNIRSELGRLDPNGAIDRTRLEHSRKQVEDNLIMIGSCDKLSDGTIKALAARKRNVLLKIQKFLTDPSPVTKNESVAPPKNRTK
jgi:hypothetical protein